MSLPISRRLLLACAAASALCASGACMRVRLMPAGARALVDGTYNDHDFALKQSMYFGPFFDVPELTLVDARPFDRVNLLAGPGGRPVSPGAAVGIIPAGTRVRIQGVDMPTLGSMIGRPNLSPRYNGWVRMRINRFDVNAPGFREDRVHVLVLPTGLADHEAVHAALRPILGDEEDVRKWLSERTPEVQEAIRTKRAVVGMTFEELTSALGAPDALSRELVAEGRRDTARYGPQVVVLLDDVVTELR